MRTAVNMKGVPDAGQSADLAESRDYYRERAGEMLKRAKNALTPEMRRELLDLANHWECLAQTSEHPNR